MTELSKISHFSLEWRRRACRRCLQRIKEIEVLCMGAGLECYWGQHFFFIVRLRCDIFKVEMAHLPKRQQPHRDSQVSTPEKLHLSQHRVKWSDLQYQWLHFSITATSGRTSSERTYYSPLSIGIILTALSLLMWKSQANALSKSLASSESNSSSAQVRVLQLAGSAAALRDHFAAAFVG